MAKKLKGPDDLAKDLRRKRADVEKSILRGESGDGRDKQDLFAVQKSLSGEIRRLENRNKKRDPKKLYPNSNHN